MSNKLNSKVTLVTGAASGIGGAISTRFAQHGADLVLVDIDEKGLRRKADEIEAIQGNPAITLVVDITDENLVRDAVKTVFQKHNNIDILINNAGRNVFGDPLSGDAQNWENCYRLNLAGAWNCCKAVLPNMTEQKSGNIINIASVHAHRIVPGTFPYPVFKHGLIGLTKSLGIEYAPHGIRVNSISPGLILTPGTEAYFRLSGAPAQERQNLVSKIPIGRIGTPEDVAEVALFLASDASGFIVATDILIDGGVSQKYAG